MAWNVDTAALLLLIAAVVALMTRRLRLPYSAGLVGAGIGLALLHYAPSVTLTKDLLFTTLLPPLIFEAAFHLPWAPLRRDLPVIVTLASGGVVLSAIVTGAGMHYVAHWDWLSAAAFGVLIAATDPVTVIATFREARASGRLRLLVEAESLFNDGTAAVAFGLVMALNLGQGFPWSRIAWTALVMVGGGIACGVIVAGAILLLAKVTDDHLTEIAFTTVAAWGSFLLAEHFHASGVLATLTAGLLLGNLGPLALTERGREAVEAFWDYAVFLANSFVFLLMGIRAGQEDFRVLWLAALIGIAVVLAGRAAAIYPLGALFSGSKLRIPLRQQHILFWGGLRGALALALAMGIPPGIPRRGEIIGVSFAVAAFSIFVQGLTIAPLLRRMGLQTRKAEGELHESPPSGSTRGRAD